MNLRNISDDVKAVILILTFIVFCIIVGNKLKESHRNEVCNIQGKSTYIYGGYEYSCFNGGKVK